MITLEATHVSAPRGTRENGVTLKLIFVRMIHARRDIDVSIMGMISHVNAQVVEMVPTVIRCQEL